MLFKNLNLESRIDKNISEGNFISKDFLGIFDSDATSKLTGLTIDKMFEGLDLEKSAEMHDFIKTFAPSLDSQSASISSPSIPAVLGIGNSSNTAHRLIDSQLHYMETRLEDIERTLDKYYKDIEVAYSKYTSKEDVEGSVAGYTTPDSISSIIPEINELVQEAVNARVVDFKSDRVKAAFSTLHKLKINQFIKAVKDNILINAETVPLTALYRKIDAFNLEEITSENAIAPEFMSYIEEPLDLNRMYKSFDPISRISAFLEDCLMQYEYGKTIKRAFSENYTLTFNSEDHLSSGVLKVFAKNIDYSVFEPMRDLLYDVAATLIKRVYAQDYERDSKNIFVPSLQLMWVSMISLLAFKLINYNYKIQTAYAKRGEELKKEADLSKKKLEQEKLERPEKLLAIVNKLESLNFFQRGGLVYKVGSMRMNPEIVKLINNFFILYKSLDISRWNDTNYDSKTAEAVLSFQKANNLKYLDGKIGNETRGMMKESAAEIFADKGIKTTNLDPFSPLLYKI